MSRNFAGARKTTLSSSSGSKISARVVPSSVIR
jgi:hypothetical protein